MFIKVIGILLLIQLINGKDDTHLPEEDVPVEVKKLNKTSPDNNDLQQSSPRLTPNATANTDAKSDVSKQPTSNKEAVSTTTDQKSASVGKDAGYSKAIQTKDTVQKKKPRRKKTLKKLKSISPSKNTEDSKKSSDASKSTSQDNKADSSIHPVKDNQDTDDQSVSKDAGSKTQKNDKQDSSSSSQEKIKADPKEKANVTTSDSNPKTGKATEDDEHATESESDTDDKTQTKVVDGVPKDDKTKVAEKTKTMATTSDRNKKTSTPNKITGNEVPIVAANAPDKGKNPETKVKAAEDITNSESSVEASMERQNSISDDAGNKGKLTSGDQTGRDGSAKFRKGDDVIPKTSEGNNHFVVFLFFALFFAIVGYVLFQKRKKILGYLIEGRRTPRSRRTSGTKDSKVPYKPLETDDQESGAASFKYVY